MTPDKTFAPISETQAATQTQARQQLRARRINQIGLFLIAAMGLRVVQLALDHPESGPATLQLLLGLCSILAALWLNNRGATNIAAAILLPLITIVMAVLVWNNDGLFDTALYAFPCILVIAGLLSSRRQFYLLMFGMMAFIVILAMRSVVPHISADYTTYDRAVDLLIILAVSGMSMRLMIGDLQTALRNADSAIALATQTQSSLFYLAQHDSLTTLPNRLLGRDRIEQALTLAQRNHQKVAILFVDLDNFKTINDTLGHDSGDLFLKQVASRLLDSVRKTDIISRQGGDEFLIGITDATDADAISIVAQHILNKLAAPFPMADAQISVSCSIGIAVFPDDGERFETLVQLADLSMYQAKEAGRNTFRFYDPTMNSSIVKNLHLNSSLRVALTENQFMLHYQPLVDITTRQVVGAEALIRWQHPELGMILPGEFISASEKSGLIVDIGEWVLHEACRQQMAWQTAGMASFVLSVNLSPVQLKRGNIESVVSEALTRSGLAPCYLELEITETALIDDAEKFIATLGSLKALGVRISIDDFGTGYSNLSYLQRFAVDKLKIDQSFVHRLNNGPKELAIVTAIIQMAKSLDLSTTAEGIDDEQTRVQLAALGCDHGQGYYFARACPAEEFEAFVSANRASLPG